MTRCWRCWWSAPAVVSFHFGLPDAGRIAALKNAGCVLLATATCLGEALAAKAAGIDALVAQGWEAGGHRGVFDPDAHDARLAPGADPAAGEPQRSAGDCRGRHHGWQRHPRGAALGAIAAQLGTAFVACPESSADAAYREALAGPGALATVMTSAISGRPARGLRNRFTQWGESVGLPHPGYPMTYDAGKALMAAAKAAGETGYAAQWAGQGAPLSRPCLLPSWSVFWLKS
jgi:nitronate monooxygenase